MAASTSPAGGSTSRWPEATLFVVNWNGRERLARYLPSLLALDYPVVRVVVIDNASTDDSVAWLAREMPGVVVLPLSENLGYGPALNIGWQQATTPLVGFLNNDVELRPDWLRAAAAALATDERLALVGSKLLYPDGETIQHAGGALHPTLALAMHHGYRERDSGQFDQPAEVEYVTGAALLARREALVALGGFDEAFRFYFDEADLCTRLRHGGWRIGYAPAAVAIHHESQTIVRDSADYLHAYHGGRLLYVLKHQPIAHFLGAFVPAEAGRHPIIDATERAASAAAYREGLRRLPDLNARRTAPPWSPAEQAQVAAALARLAQSAEAAGREGHQNGSSAAPARRLRILHVSPGYWPYLGGAERFVQAVSERLVRDGHEVTVVCSDALVAENYWIPGKPRAEPPVGEHNGVRIVRCPVAHPLGSAQTFPNLRRLAMALSLLPGTLPILRRLGRYLPWLPGLEATLARLGPFDLVHGINISLEAPLLAAWHYARARGLPFVATPLVHTGVPGDRTVEWHYTMRHQLEALRGSDRVLAQTTIEATRLAELGVPPERLALLGMGIDPAEVAPPAVPLPVAAPFVAFLGSITRDKGAIHLVEACRLLWARGAGPAALVMGGTPVTEFTRYYATLPPDVQQRVRLLGPLSEAQKWQMLASAALLAMPSQVDSFGIVFLEAWALGKPVIGARAGGIPGVIDDGEDGLLVPYGDVEALAAAIASLLADPARAAAFGARGQAKVHDRYTWEQVYTRLLGHYTHLVAQPTAAEQP